MSHLDASAVSAYSHELKSILASSPVDGAAVVTALTTYDQSKLTERLEQVLVNHQVTNFLSAADQNLILDALANL